MSEIIIVRKGNFNISDPIENKPVVKLYEVIRLIKSKPLFLEDHLERFSRTAQLSHLNLWMNVSQIKSAVQDLISANEKTEGNIKIEFEFRILENRSQFTAKFIPHSYPSLIEYAKGVKIGILKLERENAQAKVENQNSRNQADELIKEKQLYEVLLLNNEGCLTEGSRSNVFFIAQQTVFTAPPDSFLHGITYLKVLEYCRAKQIEVVEKKIRLDELSNFDAAFITGTSPMVLPIQSIEDRKYNVHHILMQEISKAYQKMVAQYLKTNEYGF